LRWHLFLPELLCRECLSLTYETKRTKFPAPLRARRLRRRMGGPLQPLGSLPQRPSTGAGIIGAGGSLSFKPSSACSLRAFVLWFANDRHSDHRT
jgi:hypothetical protein